MPIANSRPTVRVHDDGSSAKVLTVENPATEEVLREVDCTTQSEFSSAVGRADVAFKSWRRDESARRESLRQCAAVLRRRKNSFELANLLTQEQGKPKREAFNEVHAAAHWFSSIAEIEIPTESFATENGTAEVRYQPRGIVGAMTAWNFPIFLAASKIASALLPGNVVLLKPSPYTPLSTMRLVEMLTQDSADQGSDSRPLPKHVVTVLIGDQDVGNWLVESADVSHLSFTGSTRVGKSIAEKAMKSLKPVTLELGGNDAAIVLADADVEAIAERLFWGAFTNAGQFCTGIKRVYAEEPVYERIVAELTRIANETVVGDGLNPKTQMGPLTHEKQRERLIELVQRCKDNGAMIHCGGDPIPGPGHFYLPTIVTQVSNDDPLVMEEQFGPALPVLMVRDIEHAIKMANSTSYGLGGSVWTRNQSAAAEIATELECGTTWINHHGILDPRIPFGGLRQSGLGCENGWPGIAELTTTRVIYAS